MTMNNESTLLLSEDDVIKLTGYKQASEQRRQLEVMGIRFFKQASGKPIVPMFALEMAMNYGNKLPKDMTRPLQAGDGFKLRG